MVAGTGAEPPDDDASIAFAQLVAEQTGRSVEDVLALESMKDRYSPVITAVLHSSPGTLIGSKLPLRPQDAIELHLKGEVSPRVKEIIKQSGLTVIVRDGQPYSLDELSALQALMGEVLRGLGINEIASSVGLPPEGAQVELVYPRQQTDLDKEEVRRTLAARLPQPFMALLSIRDDGSIPALILHSGTTH